MKVRVINWALFVIMITSLTAKKQHDKYNDDKEICVRTTEYYTLEPEIVNTSDNFNILREKYGDVFGWNNMTTEQLTEAWKNAKASDMFTICKDLASGELEGFQMPKHIQEVINFLSQESEEVFQNGNKYSGSRCRKDHKDV